MSRLRTLEKQRATARRANTYGPLSVFHNYLLTPGIVAAPSRFPTRVRMARVYYKLEAELQKLCLD